MLHFPVPFYLSCRRVETVKTYTNDKEIQNKLESLIIRKQLRYTQADIAVRCKKADSESIERLKAKLARDIEWEK
mgnify:CR=1 FL=1